MAVHQIPIDNSGTSEHRCSSRSTEKLDSIIQPVRPALELWLVHLDSLRSHPLLPATEFDGSGCFGRGTNEIFFASPLPRTRAASWSTII
jgi:hypothetical protein